MQGYAEMAGLTVPFTHPLQQQEDYKFLSHFGGKFIIHKVGSWELGV